MFAAWQATVLPGWTNGAIWLARWIRTDICVSNNHVLCQISHTPIDGWESELNRRGRVYET